MKKKITVVDDDPTILESLQILLTDEGYEVNLASSGEDFEKSLSGVVPDLVLLDYLLPGKNGIELTRSLRKQSGTEAVPVIIISASHQVEKEVCEAGASAFLEKPFDINALLDLVKKHLQ